MNEERLKELDNLYSIQVLEKQNRDKTQSIYKDLLEDQIKAKATPIHPISGSNYMEMNNPFTHDCLKNSVSSIKPCEIDYLNL